MQLSYGAGNFSIAQAAVGVLCCKALPQHSLGLHKTSLVLSSGNFR